MTAYEFTIDANPVPLGRPQFVGRRAITPAKSERFRAVFRARLALLLPREPLEGDLVLGLQFWRQCRSSADRGDLSNLVKAVEDACNPARDPKKHWRGLWRDDRQIVRYDQVEIVEFGPLVEGRIQMTVAQHAGVLA